MGRGYRLRRRRDQGMLDGLPDFDVREPGGQPVTNGVAQPLPGEVVNPAAADHVGAGNHFHAAADLLLLEDPFPFEIGVGSRHHLRIRQQLLGELAVIGKDGMRRQVPCGHVRHDLGRDLFMNRRRGIMLDVEHNSMLTPIMRQFNHLGL